MEERVVGGIASNARDDRTSFLEPRHGGNWSAQAVPNLTDSLNPDQHRYSLRSATCSLSQQRSITTCSPAWRARAAAASSMTPSWSQTALALT